MAPGHEPVAWDADGAPRSERFGDIYHSCAGALVQARHVFLGGCGLPAAWAGQRQWSILETGFGLGLNFLATWAAWQDDPGRPGLLHFFSVEAYPVAAADLLRAAAAQPRLLPLAEQLAAQWRGLLPGTHRLAFADGRVLLTIAIGEVLPMLRSQRFEADSVYLDGFSPRLNPEMWSPAVMQAVARFARRGTRLGTWTYARAVRDALAQQGFVLERAPGAPPKRDALRGTFDPHWEPRRSTPALPPVAAPGRCVVVGAGLAGAACAASLARRGWRVTVLDAADGPARGASGAPAAVFAPHTSPDDAPLSRLSRAGVAMLHTELQARAIPGQEWDDRRGVIERRTADTLRLPAGWSAGGRNTTWTTTPERSQEARLGTHTPAFFHTVAGWVRPERLVAAWLAQPGVTVRTRVRVARLASAGTGWRLLDDAGGALETADRVVLAAGVASRDLTPGLDLRAVRGQLAWGWTADAPPLPEGVFNGEGHFIHPVASDGGAGTRWVAGASFERGDTGSDVRPADLPASLDRLARLHPAAAEALAPAFAAGKACGWAGVRCTSRDRRPLVGPVDGSGSLWALTALGSRGLTFAHLCAELLAARWHGEPLPLPAALAQALDLHRHA
ncbi:FAD-dependent 5-carboxymethylaminomethyl-2-thiouridine(34) oxidoreductase MnmC [Xylophilus sp.]|uniref:FAD-dependent 5-carboxymethylaminomethyl-2-thiouridine(34) oxidoreductase MnmC n=1 Tax=Xylophilus sp. TaxID=2653893 RepID=UPI0013BA3EA9|nr:FAD-dependent 5-carboxymethylaminomethyl-2-thiouridine(34) oxidoreductase MnmC [Xylophilus sp.]KAF1046966.1 MAG: tRNA 5-methylaminomethyl-2-thiouridine biosynthesis bifunctional protein MnmC [Xylophilus sp.]